MYHVVLPGLIFGLPIALPSFLVAYLCMGDLHAGVFMHVFILKWIAFCLAGFVFVVPATCALPLCVDVVYFERILLLIHIFGEAGIV